MKTKNATNFKNLQNIPTWKLEEILNHPHTQGIDGRDYGPVRHELEDILFKRKQRLQEWELRKQMHGFKRAFSEMGTTKTAPKASEAIPEIPAEADEGILPVIEERMILDNGFSFVVIPPEIMPWEEGQAS